jgi:lysophospholipase L1-like esterase
MVLAAVACGAELVLRAAGVAPRPAAEASTTVPDRFTAFRLRPDVSGEEPHVTNDLGLHAPRAYSPSPAPGVLRVAVLGSSVVYGLNTSFRDTLPAAVERELSASGLRAEALNFGTHAFTLVNVSALLQAYVHQLQPQVVVVVMDLQVALPRWPALRPGTIADDGVQALGFWESLRKRGAARSALVSVFDDPRPARRWIRRASGLPLLPAAAVRAEREETRAAAAAHGEVGDARSAPPGETVSAYERRRERELAAPLAAMAAFCAARDIRLYFVTPFGPYFHFTDEELARMEVHHFLEEAARVHGSERVALGAEVELITRVLRGLAAKGPARVIDMLEASRRASLRTSAHFTPDGVHLSPQGNAALGRLVAERIAQDVAREDPGLD